MVETFLGISLLERKTKDSLKEVKRIPSVKSNRNTLYVTEFDYKIINYQEKAYFVKGKDSKYTMLECEVLRYIIYEEKTAFIVASKTDEFSLMLYDFGTNSVVSTIELPAYFEPFSIALNEDTTKLFIIAYRMGAQDLAPSDMSSLDTIPYQDHYLYTIDIEKFKVAFDGKLNKSMMSITNAIKLNKDLI